MIIFLKNNILNNKMNDLKAIEKSRELSIF